MRRKWLRFGVGMALMVDEVELDVLDPLVEVVKLVDDIINRS